MSSDGGPNLFSENLNNWVKKKAIIVLSMMYKLCNKCTFAWFTGTNTFKYEFILKMWNLLPVSRDCETKSPTGVICSVSLFPERPALSETLHNTTTFHNRGSSTSEERRMISRPFHKGRKDGQIISAWESSVPLAHSAQFKVGLGSQSFMCDTLSLHLHPHFIMFFFWPLIMIPRTWERSIILVSISMMSGCSLAPLMNSSRVNSPEITRQDQPQTANSASEETSGNHWWKPRNQVTSKGFTFSVDVNLVVYKSDNLLWGDVIRSGDVLNSLTGEMHQLF